MKIVIRESSEVLSALIAERFINLIKSKPNCVLGLATGSSPIKTYQGIIKAYQEGEISFSNVHSYNLDEYLNFPRESDSYAYFMKENLFSHVDMNLSNAHFPNPSDPEAYDALINQDPIDLQILGIGADGHIGFNEPGTSFDSKTHITPLTEQTIKDNARFFPSIDMVPTKAVTMGLSTILKAKSIVLIATGAGKVEAINALLTKEDETWPASILLRHNDVTLYLDKEAAKDILNKDIPGVTFDR